MKNFYNLRASCFHNYSYMLRILTEKRFSEKKSSKNLTQEYQNHRSKTHKEEADKTNTCTYKQEYSKQSSQFSSSQRTRRLTHTLKKTKNSYSGYVDSMYNIQDYYWEGCSCWVILCIPFCRQLIFSMFFLEI